MSTLLHALKESNQQLIFLNEYVSEVRQKIMNELIKGEKTKITFIDLDSLDYLRMQILRNNKLIEANKERKVKRL